MIRPHVAHGGRGQAGRQANPGSGGSGRAQIGESKIQALRGGGIKRSGFAVGGDSKDRAAGRLAVRSSQYPPPFSVRSEAGRIGGTLSQRREGKAAIRGVNPDPLHSAGARRLERPPGAAFIEAGQQAAAVIAKIEGAGDLGCRRDVCAQRRRSSAPASVPPGSDPHQKQGTSPAAGLAAIRTPGAAHRVPPRCARHGCPRAPRRCGGRQERGRPSFTPAPGTAAIRRDPDAGRGGGGDPIRVGRIDGEIEHPSAEDDAPR